MAQIKIVDVKTWWEAFKLFASDMGEYKHHTLVKPYVEAVEHKAHKLAESNAYTKENGLDLCNDLHGIWYMMPDTKATQAYTNWYVLCDLCSENHVLHTA